MFRINEYLFYLFVYGFIFPFSEIQKENCSREYYFIIFINDVLQIENNKQI